METNFIIDIVHEIQDQQWVDKVNDTYGRGHLCPWVSSFHPEKADCRLVGTFHNGSFNAGMKMVFSDGTAWMVRFPRGGMVSDKYADEKVAMEVTALCLLRSRTDIPVPEVRAWGDAASNTLGLGPFIMMDFIAGVSLNEILRDPNAERPARVMREDFSDTDVEFIYRQMAGFLLQIFELDFDKIGSLPLGSSKFEGTIPARPLSFKAHNILHNGGVDPFGDRRCGFATTTEYFQYLFNQDWEQLLHQPNSVCGPNDAQNKYKSLSILKELIADLVNPKFDHCKFKLICDDLGLGNLIVRSKEDLTIVGVVDLEWSYIGPAEVFASAPWWLLQDRPVNTAWDFKDDKPPPIINRYFKYLDTFIRILKEEEAKRPAHKEREFSYLLEWSRDSGAMWLHMVLSSGFNSDRSFPFRQLREALESKWEGYENKFDQQKLYVFGERKMEELDWYDENLEEIEKKQALVKNGAMTKEEFLETTQKVYYHAHGLIREPYIGPEIFNHPDVRQD